MLFGVWDFLCLCTKATFFLPRVMWAKPSIVAAATDLLCVVVRV